MTSNTFSTLTLIGLLLISTIAEARQNKNLPAWKPKIYISDQEFTSKERWLNKVNDWVDLGYDARQDNSQCPEIPTPKMNRYKTNEKMDGFQVYRIYSFRHLMRKGNRALNNREYCKATDYYGHARTSAKTERQDMTARLRRSEAFFNISDYTGAINEANRFLTKFGRNTRWSEYAHYLILRAVSRQCKIVGTHLPKCELGLYLDPEQKKISSPALLNLSFYSYLSIYKKFQNSQRYKQVMAMLKEAEVVYGKTLLSIAKYNYRQASVGHSDGLFAGRNKYPKAMYYRAAGDRYFKLLNKVRDKNIRSLALYCSVDSYMQLVRLASQSRFREIDLLNFFTPRDKKVALQIRQAREQRKKLSLQPTRRLSKKPSLRERMKDRFRAEGRFNGLLKIVFNRAQKRKLRGITRGTIKHNYRKSVDELVLRSQDIADVGYLLMEFNMPDHPLTAKARRLIFKNRLTPKRMRSKYYRSYLRRSAFLPKSECSKSSFLGISTGLSKGLSWLNWGVKEDTSSKADRKKSSGDFFSSLFGKKSEKKVKKKKRKKVRKRKARKKKRKVSKKKRSTRKKRKRKKKKQYDDDIWSRNPFGVSAHY